MTFVSELSQETLIRQSTPLPKGAEFMRKISVLSSSVVVIVLGLCMSACISSYKFSHTEEKDFQVPAAGIATVDAQATNGNIDVIASDTQEIKVHVVKVVRALTQEKADEYGPQVVVHVEAQGDTLKIFCEEPKGIKQIEVDVAYAITCPPAVAIHLLTTNGSANVVGMEQSVSAQSTNGNIDLQRCKGAVNLRTTNGNISAKMTALEKEADCLTTNGDVQVEVETGAAPIRALSTNGSVTIVLPPDFSGQLDAVTTNGSVSSEFEVTTEKRSDTCLRGSVGQGGDVNVKAITTNGNVTIRKRVPGV